MITLVCIAKWNAEGYRALIADAIPHVDKIVTILDDDPDMGIDGYAADHVQYVHRPLAKDFSAQRNFAASLVTEGWLLHLDTDENLNEKLWKTLPKLAAMPCDVVVFPRWNVSYELDGTVKEGESWPDWQPRMVKPHVRWLHPVHEWPDETGQKVVRLPINRDYCIVHTKDWALQDRINSFFDTIPYHHVVCARIRALAQK